MILPAHHSLRAGRLFLEDVDLEDLIRRHGTPLYVYSRAALVDNFTAYTEACKRFYPRGESLVCYALKANSNLAIIDLLARHGAGFDIVSGGELQRVLAVGGRELASRVIFSGVGKTHEEMRFALDSGILCFNVESLSELHRLNKVAGEMSCHAPVSLRVNPDVDARTHPYISTGLKENKFGVAYSDALAIYRMAAALPNLEIVGIDCHIGSQLLDDAPLIEALDKLLELIDALAREDILVRHLDLGGGLGIRYGDEQPGQSPVLVGDYLQRVFSRIGRWNTTRAKGDLPQVLFEPGRSIVGNAGILLTRVEYLKPGKPRNFAVVDAAMNDLMRPALYEAWHDVVPLVARPGARCAWDVVGPICESGDWLARGRELALEEGDAIALLSAGAYGMSMASNYNTRPRAMEVLVDGAFSQVIRERESVTDLLAVERPLIS